MGFMMDTSAWIEILRGSKTGEDILEHIQSNSIGIPELLTHSIVIAEMRRVYLRDGEGEKFFEDLEKIKNFFIITEIDLDTAISAGEKYAKYHTKGHGISYIDCILWALSEKYNVKLISTDRHFKNCSQAVYFDKSNRGQNK